MRAILCIHCQRFQIKCDFECEVSLYFQQFLNYDRGCFCWWAAMVFDACASFEGERHWKQGSWWVVRQFCTQTMQPLAHRTKKTTKYFRTKAFKKKSKTIILLPLKKGGKGELSGRFISWTQCKRHQSKESIHKWHAANQEHITSPEVSKTSQSASIRCSKRPIKKGLQPSQSNTHHTEKRKDGRERERQRKEKYKGMQEEEPVHMKRHRKNTYMMWRRERQREWTIHPNVQFL